jgi:hypothetical protein
MAGIADALLAYFGGEGVKGQDERDDRERQLNEFLAKVDAAKEASESNRTYVAPGLIPENPPMPAAPPGPEGAPAAGGASSTPAPPPDAFSWDPTPVETDPADVVATLTAPPSSDQVSSNVEFAPPPAHIQLNVGSSTGTAPSADVPAVPPMEPAAEFVAVVAWPAPQGEPGPPAAESTSFAYGRVEHVYQPAAPPESRLSWFGIAWGWKTAGGLAAAVLLLGLLLFVLFSHRGSSNPAASTGSHLPTTPTSPVTQPGTSSNLILIPNNTLAFVGDVCKGGTLHLSWTLTGIVPNTAVVVHMSGRGLPSSVTYQANPGQPFGQDFPISGAGTWGTAIVSIAGRPPPPAVAPDTVHSGPYTC